jgi:putative ABC transport system permease protein
LTLFGGDLGAGYFSGLRPALKPEWRSASLYLAFGIVAATTGALAPAWEAASAPPARALKAGDEARALARLNRLAPGLVCLGAAVLAAWLPPVRGLPLFGYAAVALMLVGAILLLPRAAQYAFGRLPGGGAVALQIAQAQLKGAPGTAAVAGAGILASVALAAAMAIMVSSFRGSLDEWLDQMLPADLYARAGRAGETGFLNPAQQDIVRTTPGVARVQFQRQQSVLLDAERPPPALLARTLPHGNPRAVLPLVAGGKATHADLPPIWVSEAMVDIYGYRLGGEVEVPLAGQMQRFVVAGVWRDYARQTGAVVMDIDTYRRLTGDRRVTDFSLWLAPGHSAAEVTRALRQRLAAGDRIEIAAPGEIRRRSLRLFDRTFAVTYAMEAVAILIGLAGVAASFGALAVARRREFGVLRHIGMTRVQIAAMLGVEGALVAGLGVGLGLALGAAIGVMLIHVINRQSFHWSMDMSIPLGSLALFGFGMVALAAAVSVVAARRAMHTEAVQAVREDW